MNPNTKETAVIPSQIERLVRHLENDMTDMTDKLFELQPFGQAALKKIGDVPENFRLYDASWMGNDQRRHDIMRVTGAEFRPAKRGPEKGLLSVMVPNTKRTVYVSAAEMREFMDV